MSKLKKPATPGIILFEIAADHPERARKFYEALFGWKIKPLPGAPDYWHIDTGGGSETPGGCLTRRLRSGQTITNHVNVPSIPRYMARVWELGGKICSPKKVVPGRGSFAMCRDTENNTFALWETKIKSK